MSRHRKANVPDAGNWSPTTKADANLRPWLEIESSLSTAIARQCPSDAPFRVTPLYEGTQRPLRDEASVIGSPLQKRVYARDVLLLSGTTPLVYAHTVLLREHLRHPWHHLVRIGTRPLGSLLFAHPAIHPGKLHYRRLDARHPLWHRASAYVKTSAAQLWARRALFTLQGHSLLVTEVFLPGIQRLPQPHQALRF